MAIIDFILHIDQHLATFLQDYGSWVYIILFAIIFVETGVVIMPFLPGDSLLFAAGMLAAQYPESLNVWYVIVILIAAAFLGDTVNYFIGKYMGEKALRIKVFGRNFIKQEHIDKTHSFFEKYGATTIIIARFVPFVRTLAPFVAGVGHMKYRTFLSFNIIGALIWVIGLSLAGYFLGQFDIVRNNFEKVVLLIIFISIVPIIVSIIKNKLQPKQKPLEVPDIEQEDMQ
jgi:membrane-associated protein